MRKHQILQHQHLLPLRNLTARQGKHHRVIRFYPLACLVNRSVKRIILIAMLFFPGTDALFRRRFVLDPFKRGNVEAIDLAKRFC